MFGSLSDKQKQIAYHPGGKFVVKACPGSGKTYSVAARFASNMLKWTDKNQGVATISFTNVAWQEIALEISKETDIKVPIQDPHFLGTIDSFINKFIFLPFGHLVMGCVKRPTLVGEPYGIWTGKFFHDRLFDNVSYNINGQIYAIDPRGMPSKWRENKHLDYIESAKNRLLKAGYANQTDANYFALKVLQHFPSVSKALVKRFSMLMVDEAQDTTDVQMAIIDLLITNGLNEVVLVGDPDQAIFEWNEAKPELFIKKFDEWRSNSIELNENRRSSERICSFTSELSSFDEISEAVNSEVKDFEFSPEIVIYQGESLKDLLDYFLGLCGKYNIKIERDKVAVLYRSRKFFEKIADIPHLEYGQNPWVDSDNYTKDFAKGKYFYDKGDLKAGFRLIENAILKILTEKSSCSREDLENIILRDGFTEHRRRLYNILLLLPKTDCNIGEWILKANDNLKKVKHDISLQIKKGKDRIGFDQLFAAQKAELIKTDYYLGTIHSVKGETFEAVLVILGKKGGLGKYYKTLLDQNVLIKQNEELRIVYVGMTRPRKILVLAVPDQTNKLAWEGKLLG